MNDASAPFNIRLRTIMDAGYLIERAPVNAGLVIFRAQPTDRAPHEALPLEGRGADNEEAINALYAAWARSQRRP